MRGRLNTPTFRVALTIGALWMIGWVVAGFVRLRAVEPFEMSQSYREEVGKCADDRIDLTNNQLPLRPPTIEERNFCVGLATSTFRKWEAAERRGTIADAAKWAVIPAFLILMLAAFWRDVLKLVTVSSRAYAEWVRGGSGSNSRSSADEPLD